MNIDHDLPHTAIPTWSGFIYQGKIAIYHLLSLFIKDPTAERYSLQLDSIDDFSVLDVDNSVISNHQVKAKVSDLYNDYSPAFSQCEKQRNEFNAKDAYFHLTQNIRDKTIEEIQELHPDMCIYKYGANTSCKLNELENALEDKVRKLYSTRYGGENWKTESQYIDITIQSLEKLIVDKVLEIHSKNQDQGVPVREEAYNNRIAFCEFKTIIESDLNDQINSDAYFLHLTRSSLGRYYHDYSISEKLTDEEKDKMQNYLSWIDGLETSKFIEFFRQLIPHRDFKLDTIADFKDNNIDEEGIKSAFLNILKDLRRADNFKDNYFSWKNDIEYLPTTIVGKATERANNQLRKKIVDNILNTDFTLAFEGGKLLTEGFDEPSLMEAINHVNKLEDQDIENLKDHREAHISSWLKVSFISVENVKDTING